MTPHVRSLSLLHIHTRVYGERNTQTQACIYMWQYISRQSSTYSHINTNTHTEHRSHAYTHSHRPTHIPAYIHSITYAHENHIQNDIQNRSTDRCRNVARAFTQATVRFVCFSSPPSPPQNETHAHTHTRTWAHKNHRHGGRRTMQET